MVEKEIERRMREMVCKRGGLFYKFVSPGNRGVHDRIIITPAGVVWFVELKTDEGRLAPLQKYQRGELKKRNANVRVLHGWEAVKEFLQEVFESGI